MEDDLANERRAALDAALATEHPNVVVSFGFELFQEFVQRKWITWEPFGVLGTGLFGMNAPAYGKSHIVLPTHDLGDQFRVGI